MGFAEKLKVLRESAGLSQYALAKRAGLSKQGLSKLELGQRKPAWTTVLALAKALGVSCEAFADAEVSVSAEQLAPPVKEQKTEPESERPAPQRRRRKQT
jgi:transcriptional regulator with XRE-family HTH domain